MMGFLSQAGSILLGILLLGVLVAVHEFGHFMAARLTGIEVQEFAIGMGPKIFGWTGKKSGTKFSLRWVPFGGFCAFYGEDDAEGKTKDDPRAYNKQAVWKRMITVAMGPVMNFILAFVVLAGYCWYVGDVQVEPFLSAVEESGPAYAAGIRAEDMITEVNGVNMLDGTQTTLLNAIDGDQPLTLTIRRGEETFETTATPFWDEDLQKYRIGVTINGRITGKEPIGLGTAVQRGWDECIGYSTAILDALKGIITKGEGIEDTGGPVAVVTMVSQTVNDYGLDGFITLLGFISVNLGIMNLLPIPGLDGSRLVFHAIEGVRGKPVKQEVEATIHLVGMLILFALIILMTVRDVWRLF